MSKKETRKMCEYLIVKEKDGPSMDDNNPFDWPPRCAYLKKLRESDPALDRQFGPFDSCCMVATVAVKDITQYPQWCPPMYGFRELSWAMYNHYLPTHPTLKKIKHCEICVTPIILSMPLGPWRVNLCRKCHENTRDIINQPVPLIGEVSLLGKYYDESKWR